MNPKYECWRFYEEEQNKIYSDCNNKKLEKYDNSLNWYSMDLPLYVFDFRVNFMWSPYTD